MTPTSDPRRWALADETEEDCAPEAGPHPESATRHDCTGEDVDPNEGLAGVFVDLSVGDADTALENPRPHWVFCRCGFPEVDHELIQDGAGTDEFRGGCVVAGAECQGFEPAEVQPDEVDPLTGVAMSTSTTANVDMGDGTTPADLAALEGVQVHVEHPDGTRTGPIPGTIEETTDGA